jgi:hypothetical protein
VYHPARAEKPKPIPEKNIILNSFPEFWLLSIKFFRFFAKGKLSGELKNQRTGKPENRQIP